MEKKYFLNRCMKQIRQMMKLFSTKLCEKEGIKPRKHDGMEN